ncbi:baseplate J/gp47 family protein [Paenibacillus sp. RUD330]|uniref:baseplate J/gp47 family protein n=1 Tax=Paenibacillus sp. RUD330 TaxID=2023772 RepID=UPI001F0EAB20|nr:baseplate J/gp47 family protein [Paenibacillus sp. RUD330]
MAWFLAYLWSNAEDVYNSGYKDTAEGVSLDRLGPYVGIERRGADYAAVQLRVTGTPLKIVPAGWRAATETGVYFETTDEVTIPAGGHVLASARAVSAGLAGNTGAGTITIPANPDPDITAVTNPAAASGGRERETDFELRQRWDLSVASGGASTLDSLRAGLLDTPGVRAAIVAENYTMQPVAGRPAKSIEAYVLGGADADIGQTLLGKKAAGIEPYGSVSVQVLDEGGFAHTMRFSRATEVPIRIRLTLAVNNRYPAGGDGDIISAAIRYIGGEDSDGQLFTGLNMGESVKVSQLIGSVLSIAGVTDVQVQLSRNNGASWTGSNLTLAAQEVAQTSYQWIEVTRP